jgi:hypothetical protein
MNPFGSCCDDLREALETPETKLIKVGPEGILYLTVGSVKTDAGTAWMEQAVLYCPFCGAQLQTEDDLLRKALTTKPTVH